MIKTLFLDRDGCLIKDKNYAINPDEIEFMPGVIENLKELSPPFRYFIITNQSGIGRGYFTKEQVDEFHEALIKKLADHDIIIFDVVMCPHTPEDNCDCRKPHPKMINFVKESFDIDLKNSYMIGDKISDAECGKNAGINSILIGNHNQSEFPQFNHWSEIKDYLFKSLQKS